MFRKVGLKVIGPNLARLRSQELCERRDGYPDLHVTNSPYGFLGRKATLEEEEEEEEEEEDIGVRAQELCESRGGRPGLPDLNSPYGLCGRKATLEEEEAIGVRIQGLRESGRKATLNFRAQELRSCVKVEVAVLGSP